MRACMCFYANGSESLGKLKFKSIINERPINVKLKFYVSLTPGTSGMTATGHRQC